MSLASALLALRLGGLLLARRSGRFAAWGAGLLCYAAASAALAWGAAAGWDDRVFRVYYLFGALLTAPLLGLGSLLLVGVRRAVAPVLVYAGLALGVSISEPLTAHVTGERIPEAQAHLDVLPARLLAIVGNSLGTLAVVAIAVVTFRRRPVRNVLLLAGIAVAAAGSAVAGLGEARTAVFGAVAVALLYGGVAGPPSVRLKARRRPVSLDAG